MSDLRVVGHRCDKLEFAYRVVLDPAFMAYLRKQATIARAHGRAEVSWRVMMPKYKEARAPESGKFRKLGAIRPGTWRDDDRLSAEPRTVLWGELRYSRTEHKYVITNEPYFAIVIDPHGPGSVLEKDEEEAAARAPNMFKPDMKRRSEVLLAKAMGESEARAGLDHGEPGFTVSISVYAQHLARHGLVSVERECEEIAWMLGEVREKRLRRIDLCADVAGMTLREDDVTCIVKRSRAAWVKNFADGAWCDASGALHAGATDAHGAESGRATFARASGPVHRCHPECRAHPEFAAKLAMRVRKRTADVVPVGSRDPRLTGISVGRGGAMMMRIYDKREEMARADDRALERREVEEQIWRARGWDGVSAVWRVEFQIRGEALRELGLRDPDCMREIERDNDGNAIGQIIATVRDAATGRMRKACLVDWLDNLWITCLRWCRLIVPAVSRSGNARQADRCELDPRWEILHTVTFTKTFAMPLARYRARGAASAAQSLGVALSQAAREGQLRERWEEKREWYERWADPKSMLRERVRLLMRDVEERCIDELIAKWGDAVGANVHLATRANAARARFMREGRVVEPRTPRVVGASREVAMGVFSIALTSAKSIVAA